jgi:hypothetical protein
VAIETWRTKVNPAQGAPYFLTTSRDPTAGGDNQYLSNTVNGATAGYTDDLTDALLAERESDPLNNGALQPLAPPPATIITATNDRIFLAGVAGQPYTVWYSRFRGDGEIASFNDALFIDIPPHHGPITALAIVDGTLIVFASRAVFALPGNGYDNLGNGINYGPAQLLTAEVGADNPDSVGALAEGLMFHGEQGWHILDRGLQVTYVGDAVKAYDADSWVAVHAIQDGHQIRCVSTSRILVYDTVVQQWSEWTIGSACHATLHNGEYYYCSSSGIFQEEPTHGVATNYSLDIELWVNLDATRYKRCRSVTVLGEYRTAHDLRIRLRRDHTATYFDDITWTVSPTVVGERETVDMGPSIQKLSALGIRITDQAVGSAVAPSGEGLTLSALALEMVPYPGSARLPAAQRT